MRWNISCIERAIRMLPTHMRNLYRTHFALYSLTASFLLSHLCVYDYVHSISFWLLLLMHSMPLINTKTLHSQEDEVNSFVSLRLPATPSNQMKRKSCVGKSSGRTLMMSIFYWNASSECFIFLHTIERDNIVGWKSSRNLQTKNKLGFLLNSNNVK